MDKVNKYKDSIRILKSKILNIETEMRQDKWELKSSRDDVKRYNQKINLSKENITTIEKAVKMLEKVGK